jgi:L-lactate utilization protein LutB
MRSSACMAGSVTAEKPSVMPAVTVAMVATAPTVSCCKSHGDGQLLAHPDVMLEGARHAYMIVTDNLGRRRASEGITLKWLSCTSCSRKARVSPNNSVLGGSFHSQRGRRVPGVRLYLCTHRLPSGGFFKVVLSLLTQIARQCIS